MSRVFTLEEARALLPRLQGITKPVYELAESLAEELADLDEHGKRKEAEELRERLTNLVESWSGAIRDMDGEVKGLWLVDFDSGDGFWCWAYPEDDLGHWHSYEEGFGARVPIKLKPEPRRMR